LWPVSLMHSAALSLFVPAGPPLILLNMRGVQNVCSMILKDTSLFISIIKF